MTAGSAASRRVLARTPVAPLPASSPTRPTGITGRMSAPAETSSPKSVQFSVATNVRFSVAIDSGDGVAMAARSFVACAATWRAVSPPSAARCAMSDSLSRRPPFPQRRHPSATPPARPSDAQQQSRPAPDTGHGPWSSRPTRRQPGRPCRAASRSGQCVTPHPSRPRGPWAAPTLSPEKTVYYQSKTPLGAPA